jgi:hypothetical protein
MSDLPANVSATIGLTANLSLTTESLFNPAQARVLEASPLMLI